MLRTIIPLCLSALIAAPLGAQTLRVENRIDVVPVAGGFEVSGGGGHGARGMWCAAATYARKVLGARGTQDIYVARGRTPGLGQRGGVVFTMDPTGLQPTSVLIVSSSLRQPGSRLSVDHAGIFCADFKSRNS